MIVHSFLRDFLINKPYRRLVNLIVNNLLHTSHAINFFFYILSAPNFRIEFVKLLKEIERFYESKFGVHIRSRANSSTATTNISTKHKSSIRTNKSLNLNEVQNANGGSNGVKKTNIRELNEKLSNGTALDANKVRKKLIKFNTANSTTQNNSLTSNNAASSVKHKNKIRESNGVYLRPAPTVRRQSEMDYDEDDDDDEDEDEDDEDMMYDEEDDDDDEVTSDSKNLEQYELSENLFEGGCSRKPSKMKRNSRSRSFRGSKDLQQDNLVVKFIDSSTIN